MILCAAQADPPPVRSAIPSPFTLGSCFGQTSDTAKLVLIYFTKLTIGAFQMTLPGLF